LTLSAKTRKNTPFDREVDLLDSLEALAPANGADSIDISRGTCDGNH